MKSRRLLFLMIFLLTCSSGCQSFQPPAIESSPAPTPALPPGNIAPSHAGDLLWKGCYGAPSDCFQTSTLDEPFEVVVSPDKTGVFAVGLTSNTLVVYDRDPATGELTYNSCFVDQETSNPDCSKAPALDGARSVAVSPDGRSIYVVSSKRNESPEGDNGIVTFDREPSTNHLQFASCIQDNDRAPNFECGPNNHKPGLSGNRAIMVSKDGASVYVAGHDDAAVTVFSRAASGELTWVGCVTDFQNPNPDTCAQSPNINALKDTHSVVLSPDDRFVYVASAGDHAINTFARDPSTSKLTWLGCVADAGTNVCPKTNPGLRGARSIAIAQDGSAVYVAATEESAIGILKRDKVTGELLPTNDCVKDSNSMETCSTTAETLGGVHFVAVSPDANSETLYAAGRGDNAIVWFDRDPSTATLNNPECIDDGSSPACTAAPVAPSLTGVTSLAVAPDLVTKSLYLVSRLEDALVWFSIQ